MYPSWLGQVAQMHKSEKQDVAREIVASISGKNQVMDDLLETIASKKEFYNPAFHTHIHFVPYQKQGFRGKINVIRWKEPPLQVKHKTLPLILIVGREVSTPKIEFEKADFTPKGEENVIEYLKWVCSVSSMKPNEHLELKNKIIDGIKSYRSKNPKKKQWLSDFLTDTKDFKIVGFAANHCYIKADGNAKYMEPLWIHPWGTPQLLLAHRKIPVMIIVGPSLRLDKTVLQEVPENRYREHVLGYTG